MSSCSLQAPFKDIHSSIAIIIMTIAIIVIIVYASQGRTASLMRGSVKQILYLMCNRGTS